MEKQFIGIRYNRDSNQIEILQSQGQIIKTTPPPTGLPDELRTINSTLHSKLTTWIKNNKTSLPEEGYFQKILTYLDYVKDAGGTAPPKHGRLGIWSNNTDTFGNIKFKDLHDIENAYILKAFTEGKLVNRTWSKIKKRSEFQIEKYQQNI